MASRGKTVQLNNMYVADFETCDAEKSTGTYDINTQEEIFEQKVWLAGFKNLETMKSEYFYNLDDFMTAILSRGDNVNTEYAFHNIKFDGSYVVPWLFANSYTCSTGKPQPKQFSILVDDRNSWYSITIQVTKRRKVLLWDSAKLFPAALEYLPDIYSTPTHKVHEDAAFYERVRPDGYIPDAQEMGYFENDLQVPAETLNKHIELFGLRFKKTQASQSFYNFEQSFKAWKWRFPALSLEQDTSIRQAYWGGISHVPKDKAGQDFYNIGVIDINSSYPDKAANFKLPYGECIQEWGEGKHPDMSKFWVAEALVTFELKPNCLPCIPKKAVLEGDVVEDKEIDAEKWLDSSEGIAKIRFSCIDYKTIHESYNFKVIRWVWSMHWAWKVQKEVAKFVNKNNDLKVYHSKMSKKCTDALEKAYHDTMRNRAKIDNNSFYGKFGEEIIKEGKTPHYEEGEIIWRTDRKDEQTEAKRKFLPVAIAITAWGRQQLVQLWNMIGAHAYYCDTDSLHYSLDAQPIIDKAAMDNVIVVDAEQLGAWKVEGIMTRGRYLRAKCYMEETLEGHREVTCAGLPADKHSGQFSKKRSCLNWENFHIGYEVPPSQSNKLRTISTRTGNKLVPTGFKIKEKANLFTA
jgi:hypothetical protein